MTSTPRISSTSARVNGCLYEIIERVSCAAVDSLIVARSLNSLRMYGASSGRVAICQPSATAISR